MKNYFKLIPVLAASLVVGCANNAENITHVTSVTVSEHSLTLEFGESYQLSATLEPEDATNKNVTWSSDNEEFVSVSETGLVTGNKAGTATITVTTVDGHLTDSCLVTVNPEIVLSSISLSNIKSDYLVGDTFVKPTVTARLSNGSSSVVTDSATFSGHDLSTAGTQTVEVSYTYKSATKTESYDITVKYPKKLDSIKVSNAKTDYFVGDDFVKPTVTAYYDDESSEDVSKSATFSGFDSSAAKTCVINVSYTYEGVEKTTSYNVTVTALKVEKITLSNIIASYVVGGTFVKPTVTATYNNGSTQDVTNSSTFTGYDLSKQGTYKVTVAFGDVSTTYTITVSEQPISFLGDYELYTQSSLEIGSYLVFTNTKSGSGYAMSTTQNTNNRGSVSTSVSNNIVTATESTATIRVEEGTQSGTYALYDEVNGGYLYAAGSSSTSGRQNYLKLATTKSSTTDFTYSYSNGQATFKSLSGAARCYLKYNSSDKLFSCYNSNSMNTSYPYVFYKSGTPVFATSITLNGDSEVAVYDNITLTIGYTPENTNQKKATWESSDPSVATVTNGVVLGLKAGTTIITATVLGENDTPIQATKEITVKTISVTGVSLNKTSADVSLGKTIQLNATVAPSNATNKNVSWKSSDTTVATVSDSGLVTASATKTGSATITVTTEDGSYTATCIVSVVEIALDEWTIMLHVSGSNLESDGGAASDDIKEALSINGQPEDVNILYQTGGTTSWRSMSGYISGATKISADRVQRWEVQDNKIVLKDDTLGQRNMADSSTLSDYIKWGVTNYPAQKYAVIFWNHGGAMQGVCIDDNYSSYYTFDYLTNSEVKQALSTVFSDTSLNINDKFEFVGYDACVMQVQDIAEFNSEYFNYMVASQELENGDGWDYTGWIDDLYAKKDTPTILTAICDSFVSQYGSSSSNDQTLSWLDLSAMPAYKEAWENMSKSLYSNVQTYCKSGKFYTWLINNVTYYGTADGYAGYIDVGIFDVKDFLTELKGNSTLYNGLSSLVSSVEAVFNQLVKYSRYGKGNNKTGSAGVVRRSCGMYSPVCVVQPSPALMRLMAQVGTS